MTGSAAESEEDGACRAKSGAEKTPDGGSQKLELGIRVYLFVLCGVRDGPSVRFCSRPGRERQDDGAGGKIRVDLPQRRLILWGIDCS